jgi:hypothetical protein
MRGEERARAVLALSAFAEAAGEPASIDLFGWDGGTVDARRDQ